MASAHTAPSSDRILQALRTVKDPDLHQDLVTLNMIRDLEVSPEGDVRFRVVLTTPACPMKDKIEGDVRQALAPIPGIRKIDLKMDAEVRAKKAPSMNSIEGVAHIIAVSSGKGGVGKSTVSTNLACALAAEGARVGLMDADIYGPNLPTMMGVLSNPKVDVHPQKGEVLLPPSAHGIKVMSMGFLVPGDQPMIWRGPMLHSMVQQFCHKVLWGELDYLVVDMPPGTGDVQLSLAQLVPVTGTVLVTTPQEVALQDVRKAYSMWEKVRIPVMGVVENMSYFKGDDGKIYHLFGQGGGQALAKKYGVPLLQQFPIVPAVREGGDEGYPVVLREPQSEIALKFRELARKVAQEVSILASKQAASPAGIEIGKF